MPYKCVLNYSQLVEGVEVMKAIEAVETHQEKPKQRIRICDCGVITFEEKEISRIVNQMESKEQMKESV